MASKTILGIDVGMTGALAFYDEDELIIYDMPVVKRNKTRRIDCLALNKIVQEHGFIDMAYIEQVNAFGMGATGAYNFGWSCGVVEAIVAALGIPFTYVTPMKWKPGVGIPKGSDKDYSRTRATQLLPRFAHGWDLKKHDGRAEASLIALYGHRELNLNKGE